MIKTALKIKWQPDVELNLPESIDEVTLEKCLDFNEAWEDNRTNIKDTDGAGFELLAIRSISAYFDVDYNLLLDNKLTNANGAITGKARGFYDAILPVFAHINNVIGSYKFENSPRQYEIGGQIFHLPYDLLGDKSLTVAESIEVLEVKRQLSTTTKNGKFTEAIRTAAILLRLEGERFPHDQPDIDNFIANRTKFFLDNKLPMRAGLDSVFFLINFIKR